MHGLDIIQGAGATFGPEHLKAITTAFDEAWSEIAPHFERKALVAEGARNKLAMAILAAANRTQSVDALKRAGLRAMTYRV